MRATGATIRMASGMKYQSKPLLIVIPTAGAEPISQAVRK
jgi:hypothetical protein